MESTSSELLRTAVQHYAQVADAVNRREMRRFIEELRRRWHPDISEELQPRGEGYTDEGHFNRCVYELAFDRWEQDELPQDRDNLCDAELQGQILLLPSTIEMADYTPKPLSEPASQDKLLEKLARLRAQLQEQLDHLDLSIIDGIAIELPNDFMELLSITNGVRGAGVPSETAHTILVYELDHHSANARSLQSIAPWVESDGYTPLAGWEMGSCMQHRQIYYILCYETSGGSTADAVWRIFNRDDVNLDIYDDLTQFLNNEAKAVNERPGGAQREHVILFDRYPVDPLGYKVS